MENKYVYVIDWRKHYSDIQKWNQDLGKRECIFPIKTELPNYCGIEYHWKYIYEPNLTLKGTINKRKPKKLVDKIPVYKNYKWEVKEVFKHPKAGEYTQSEEVRKYWAEKEKNQVGGYKISEDRYTTNNILLLASTHTDKDWMKCYIIIEESGVSELTPKQFTDEQFNALIEANLKKWDRNTIIKKDVPKEIISVFYDSNDNVLFGSSMVKGLVSYNYIDSKFSSDGKPIYLHCSISYDGKGNSAIENKELIKDFTYIKTYIEEGCIIK